MLRLDRKTIFLTAKRLVPKRYTSAALVNYYFLLFISVAMVILLIQNAGLRADNKRLTARVDALEDAIKIASESVNEFRERVDGLEKQVTSLLELVGDVQETYEIVQYRRPDLSRERAWWKAQKLTFGARKYEIPLPIVIATAWAESDFHWNAHGPCGERSMVQVMYSTFRGMRPTGDWNDLEQVFDAGLHYLRVCYQKQQQRAPDDPLVVFAYYNAGGRWSPQVAKKKAKRHVSRVEDVFRRMERLGGGGVG